MSAAAFAQASDGAYIVRDVKVDILSESAVKARDKAFGEAQKNGVPETGDPVPVA